jgi:hypothetical protein
MPYPNDPTKDLGIYRTGCLWIVLLLAAVSTLGWIGWRVLSR